MANKDTVVKAAFTRRQQDHISTQYSRGASVQELAQRWHCSKERIRLVLQETNTPLRSRGKTPDHIRASGAGQIVGPQPRQLDYCEGCKQTPCWTPMTCGPRLRAQAQQKHRDAEFDKLCAEEVTRERAIQSVGVGHSDNADAGDSGAGADLQAARHVG